MIDRSHALSISRQAQVPGDQPGQRLLPDLPKADLALVRRIDELHLDYPFAGSRMLQGLLKAEGHQTGRLHVRTLMKKMGVDAIYRRPNTSKPAPGHKIYPYLLRNLAVTWPDQVRATNITYVPMARGFVYLAAVVAWFRRKILAWRLSITLSADFCIEALEEALARHGRPEIFNTDQGSQFTATDFIKVLQDAALAISMDGKGAWRDCRNGTRSLNVFVERLWRTIKYEEIYLRAYTYTSVPEARASIGRRGAGRGRAGARNRPGSSHNSAPCGAPHRPSWWATWRQL